MKAMRKEKERQRVRSKGFQALSIVLLGLVALTVIFPFALLFISSITEEKTLLLNGYSIFPAKLSLEAYRYIFIGGKAIATSYLLSMLVTLIGTTCALSLTCTMAYPLSRRDFKRRKLFTFIVFFTMLFNGGLVPQYMMWTTIFKIRNTLFAYLIPNLMMSGFNVILVKNYFTNSIPFEIIESGKIDGASEWTIFRKMVLPLSTPILAAIGLLIALAYWNDWTNGLYYINKPKLYTFQNLLNRMIQQIDYLTSGDADFLISGTPLVIPSVGVRMAIAFVGILPILMIYPFFQKYFAAGLSIGAVKG